MPVPQAYYSQLFTIDDPMIRATMKTVFDQLNLLQGGTTAPALRGPLNVGGHPLQNLSDGTDPADAVTVSQLQAATDLAKVSFALSAAGSNPITLMGLPGMGNSNLIGTHASRLAAILPAMGTLWWETDRLALYEVMSVGGMPTWVLTLTQPPEVLLANLYTDLGAADAGFFVSLVDTFGALMKWTGTVWEYYAGLVTDTHAARLLLVNVKQGFLWCEDDRGYQVYASTGGTGWLLLQGVGGPMRDVAANRPGGLAIGDQGFRFYATDTHVTSRWDGAAWQTDLAALVNGGTNAALTPSAGALIYSTATALAVEGSVGSAGDLARSGGTGTPTWSSPAALTKVDDTNVTLTLGGTPASALVAAVRLTLGWLGLLGLARGGTNADLSATGGTGQVLQQATAGAPITVGTLTTASLSDYATGTFTPAVTFGGASIGVTYSTQAGRYTRIGNRCLYSIKINLTSQGTSVGNLVLTGLPFTNASPNPIAVTTESTNWAATITAPIEGLISAGTTTLSLYQLVAGNRVALQDTDVTATLILNLSGHYEI